MDAERDPLSPLSMAAAATRRWRWIAVCGAVGVVALALPAFLQGARYTATASFIPQGTDPSRAGLTALAGQLGVALPSPNVSQSPEFYAELVESREVLGVLARDTLTVAELGRSVTVKELLRVTSGTPERQDEVAVSRLRAAVSASVSRGTGVVRLSVATPWRSASRTIAERLLAALNDFNRRTRQSQAASERRFVEGRLQLAGEELRGSEARLEAFLRSNRQVESSPTLVFDRDRLQRDLQVKQQVYTLLTQAYEDVRIREVRDTPLLTLIEPPVAATRPDSRRRALRAAIGVVLGSLAGLVLAIVADVAAHRRASGDADVEELARRWQGFRLRLGAFLGRSRGRNG